MTACAAHQTSDSGLAAKSEIQMSQMDVNKYPVTKTVCNPMGGGSDPSSSQGLTAQLWWLNPGQKAAANTSDLIARGTQSSQSLFFSQMDVPTRLFNTGFTSDSGTALKDDNGNTLIENFAIRFTSVLQLAPSQDEGAYEFAVLSDDGTVMRLRDENGVYQPIVDSDGDHPTRMGCSTAVINMTHETQKLMQLDYYQGPRYEIALVVMMKKITPDANGKFPADSLCGATGNNTWFNPSTQKPTANYNALLSRGWQVLTKDNFQIPAQASFNPCKSGVIPNITNVKLGESFTDQVALDWDTDIPSTSQIIVTTVSSGSQAITTADNTMTLHHHVTMDGLTADTAYTVQAVSISDTYGKGISNPVAYHTAQ